MPGVSVWYSYGRPSELFQNAISAAHLAEVRFVHRGQVLLDQAREPRVGEAAVQLVEVEARDAVERRRRHPAEAIPFRPTHVPILLGVGPQAAAMRARVARAGEQRVAEDRMR